MQGSPSRQLPSPAPQERTCWAPSPRFSPRGERGAGGPRRWVLVTWSQAALCCPQAHRALAPPAGGEPSAVAKKGQLSGPWQCHSLLLCPPCFGQRRAARSAFRSGWVPSRGSGLASVCRAEAAPVAPAQEKGGPFSTVVWGAAGSAASSPLAWYATSWKTVPCTATQPEHPPSRIPQRGGWEGHSGHPVP